MTTTTATMEKQRSGISSRTKWIIFAISVAIIAFIVYLFFPNESQAVYANTLRQSTPLILGALCGLIGERSGVINIGIEGQMLMSAFVAFLTNVYLGQLLPTVPLGYILFVGVIVGVAMGAVMGLFLAWMSVSLKMDQIIGGTVINTLALGLTSYFYVVGLSTRGKIPALPLGPLADIPLIGPVLFKNPPITYLTIILIFVVQFGLFRTVWGLRTRSVGEHPGAADTVGISVSRIRYLNVTVAGAFAGLAGAYLSLEAVGSFERAMTNGRGFVALAVMIFGRWTPLGAWGAALLFGLFSALSTQFQFWGVQIPHQFIGMLPYVLTIVVLAGFGGRARPPAAVGQVYDPE
ncbi:MAG: ABC transporter permease [Candidatus Promineifilaceae bacterium]|nr:ABC transporter permease [Candidatus Promineifilaceae bacterium]